MALAGDNGTADSKRSSKRVSRGQAPPEAPAGEVASPPEFGAKPSENTAPPAFVENTDEGPALMETVYSPDPTVLTLTPTEWATYSSALDTSPHMVLGALMDNRPYGLDEATALVAAFLSSPAEKE